MRVAVVSGGRSSEHEVSLASGEAVRAGLAEAGHEVLDERARSAERLTLALRTRPGIKLGDAEADLSDMAACLDELAGAGLVETDGARAHLTRRGRLLATAVTARVLDALDGHPVVPAGTR